MTDSARSERMAMRLKSDYNFLVDHGYEVVGVFNYGSDNYGMETESSDIDTKAIVLPKFDDIVDSKEWVSKDYAREEDGGKLDVKDIRLMFNSYLKQNINFLETLFTAYYRLNDEYAPVVMGVLQKEAEKIARYNPLKAILTMYGNMKMKYKALFHEAPHSVEQITKYGYSLKDFHHMARLLDFMQRYMQGEKYEDILIPNNKELILSYKTVALPVDEVKEKADIMMNEATALADDAANKWKDLKPNVEVEEMLQKVQRNFIAHSLQKELCAEGKDFPIWGRL